MKNLIPIVVLFLPLSGIAQQVMIPSGSTVQSLKDGKSEKTINDKNIQLAGDSPLLVKPTDSIPLLIFAANSSTSVIDIKKIDLKPYLKQLVVEDVNQAMNEVTSVHVEVQGLIQKRNIVQALDRIKDLQNKYPGLALGYFLEGTAQYLLGNKELAVKALEQGLQISPQDENAKKLLVSIKGGAR